MTFPKSTRATARRSNSKSYFAFLDTENENALTVFVTETGEFLVIGNNAGSYNSYVALITQAGVAAPTAKVLHNGIDEDNPVISYNAVGEYYFTLPDAFTEDKTFAICGGSTGSAIVETERISKNVIALRAYDAAGAAADGKLKDSAFEIRVYN